MGKRLSICYAVPGHYLRDDVGPTRNVLSVAEALSQVADVTLAFRKVVEPDYSPPYKIVELDPARNVPPLLVDDSAVRGTKPTDLLRYLVALRKFAAAHHGEFDIVLEKSWLLSGYLADAFQRRGVPGVLVENLVRVYDESLYGVKSVKNYFRHSLSQAMVRRYARKSSAIIAETEELKDAMTELWGIAADQVEVIHLGVDSRLFHPADQGVARQRLGIDRTATVMLYVGVLDRCHNLGPVIEALSQLRRSDLQLHVVGDGLRLGEFEQMAIGGNASVVFHGRVPHPEVPQFIAAANLCLAPYEPQAFFKGIISFSTLKILEYMACARPVVSVPSGHIFKLVQHGINGFLVPNLVSPWTDFLRAFPSFDQLKEMGIVAARTASHLSWEHTAASYLQLCTRLIETDFGRLSE